MNEVQKSLKKLSLKERQAVERAVERLLSRNWHGLNVVKLKGSNDIYRARVGNVRVIFYYRKGKFNILAIEHRSEKTYRNF